MLQLSSAGKRFGPRVLFEGANWLVTPGERTALVGANGTGKSTLMKTLAGLESLDYGTLDRARNVTIGYLPQDGLALCGRSVFEECLAVFAELRGMEQELETLSTRLAELDPASAEYAAAANRFSHLDGRFRAGDGYALDAQVGAVLDGLGFSKEDWSRQTQEFSGGWQMRIALARLLLAKPSLLLLDEPTNHLDLETRNWLEQYLHGYPNGYILISHDRYFLDVTVTRIVEIWNKGIHFYAGNYEKYLQQKGERRAQLESAYRNQREHIEHLETFINRFRAQATKAKQVQSRIKELEKIERIEIPEEEKAIHFTFPQPPASGRTVVEVKGLTKSYGAKQVLTGVDFTIERGDRIALVGANGAGKSTLIRMLSGSEPATGGMLKLGHNVTAEYFAQDQYKVLDADARMLDDLSSIAPRVPTTDLRSLLGCFLFSGDDAFKPLGVLSGGERNRYALARILVSPANFLLLDEPTNHLDLRAKDVLLEAVRNFSGTVVFVSHDRYFIDGLATRVFEVEGGKVHVYPGNYEDFLRSKAGSVAPASANGSARAPAIAPKATETVGEQSADVPKGRRLNPIKIKQMQERVQFVEEEIPRVEAGIADAEQALGIFVSVDETQERTEELARLRAEHESLSREWEELVTLLEEQASV
jgi:ATP-binding cassette subfamily F protein 3